MNENSQSVVENNKDNSNSQSNKLHVISLLVCLAISTIILIVFNTILYGTETIWIADYMPSTTGSNAQLPWAQVLISRTAKDMIPADIFGIVLTVGEYLVLKAMRKLPKANIARACFLILMCVVPLLIAAWRLSTIYGCTF